MIWILGPTGIVTSRAVLYAFWFAIRSAQAFIATKACCEDICDGQQALAKVLRTVTTVSREVSN